MQSPKLIEGLSEIADRYDALLCDAWGVIHNGVEIFDGVPEALIAFREKFGPVVILTNAPRPSTIIPGQLDRLGMPRAAWDDIATSGDATRAAIEEYLPKPAYRLGPGKDDPLFEDLPIEFTDLEEAGFIICTGLKDELREEPESYRPFFERAVALGLPMVCANPDIVVNWGGRIIWCAGALAQIYEELGGHVVYGGKPYAPIYDLAIKRIDAIRKRPTDRARILAIGDGLKTDIAGANAQGLDVLFVGGAGGIHQGEFTAEAVSAQLSKAGLTAIGAMAGLRW